MTILIDKKNFVNFIKFEDVLINDFIYVISLIFFNGLIDDDFVRKITWKQNKKITLILIHTKYFKL